MSARSSAGVQTSVSPINGNCTPAGKTPTTVCGVPSSAMVWPTMLRSLP